MKRIIAGIAGLGATIGLIAIQPEEAVADAWGCACLHNHVGSKINYRHHFGTGQWKNDSVPAGGQDVICWNYGKGPHKSPNLQFQLDVDMTKGNAWTTYNIVRYQSKAPNCGAVPAGGHYSIRFRPGTNNQYIHIVKGGAAPAPSPSNKQFGCACLNNQTQHTINYRHHFGTNQWKNDSVPAGGRDVICWNYGTGPHTSPNLQFQLDVDMTKGNAWTTYNIVRYQSAAANCAAVPAGAQYAIRYRPGTNKQFIHIVKK